MAQIRLGMWGKRNDEVFTDPNSTVVTSIDPFAEFFTTALRQCKLRVRATGINGDWGSLCGIAAM